MNPLKSRREKRSSADRKRANEMLPAATDALKATLDRASQMSEKADLKLCDVLEVLDEIGKAATRLVTLIRAEQELTGGSDLHAEIDQAIKELFGHRAAFLPEGGGGTGENNVPPA